MFVTDLSKEMNFKNVKFLNIKKIEKYLKYLKIKYTFKFNDYFSFFLLSNDGALSKSIIQLIFYSWRNRARPCLKFYKI